MSVQMPSPCSWAVYQTLRPVLWARDRTFDYMMALVFRAIAWNAEQVNKSE